MRAGSVALGGLVVLRQVLHDPPDGVAGGAFELVVELPIRGLSLAALVELAAHRLADAKQPFRVRFDQCSGPGGVVFAS